MHPRDWIEVYYCCPGIGGVKNWSSGSTRMEHREIGDFVKRRMPILITNIITIKEANREE